MNKEFLKFSFDFFTGNFVRNKIKDVNKKPMLMNNNEENADSIIEFRKNPTRPAGIVAIIKNVHNFRYGFLKVKSSNISFLVKIKTAINDDRCSIVKKNRFGLSKRIE